MDNKRPLLSPLICPEPQAISGQDPVSAESTLMFPSNATLPRRKPKMDPHAFFCRTSVRKLTEKMTRLSEEIDKGVSTHAPTLFDSKTVLSQITLANTLPCYIIDEEDTEGKSNATATSPIELSSISFDQRTKTKQPANMSYHIKSRRPKKAIVPPPTIPFLLDDELDPHLRQLAQETLQTDKNEANPAKRISFEKSEVISVKMYRRIYPTDIESDERTAMILAVPLNMPFASLRHSYAKHFKVSPHSLLLVYRNALLYNSVTPLSLKMADDSEITVYEEEIWQQTCKTRENQRARMIEDISLQNSLVVDPSIAGCVIDEDPVKFDQVENVQEVVVKVRSSIENAKVTRTTTETFILFHSTSSPATFQHLLDAFTKRRQENGQESPSHLMRFWFDGDSMGWTNAILEEGIENDDLLEFR